MSAYYNENDAYAAQWLRNLIAAGHIAPGDVDERSIVDVRGDDLRGYTQCHFFAGIGVWSYALRLAGWPDDRPVWTGSCPCQPFSAAGRSAGFCDERHLWPHWSRLIGEQRPVSLFGEQVASADGLAWLDFVCADLEAAGYAVGAVDTCAAGFGAPHIRQRLYFVAESASNGRARYIHDYSSECGQDPRADNGHGGNAGELADPDGRNPGAEGLQRGGEHGQAAGRCGIGDMGDSDDARSQGRSERAGNDVLAQPGSQRRERGQASAPGNEHDGSASNRTQGEHGLGESGAYRGPTNSFWSDAHWLPCIDGKARPTKSGLFPLAYGIAGRVGKLRAAGNAICAPQAAEFIRAYREIAA